MSSLGNGIWKPMPENTTSMDSFPAFLIIFVACLIIGIFIMTGDPYYWRNLRERISDRIACWFGVFDISSWFNFHGLDFDKPEPEPVSDFPLYIPENQPAIHANQNAVKRHVRHAEEIFDQLEKAGCASARYVILLHPETRERLGVRSVFRNKTDNGEVRSVLYLDKFGEYIHENSLSKRIHNNNELAIEGGSLLMVVMEQTVVAHKFIKTIWVPTHKREMPKEEQLEVVGIS